MNIERFLTIFAWIMVFPLTIYCLGQVAITLSALLSGRIQKLIIKEYIFIIWAVTAACWAWLLK